MLILSIFILLLNTVSATVLKYICHFQDLLRYCRRQGLINIDINDIFEKPKLDKNKNVWQPFEIDELKKIFNPKTYFKRKNDNVDDNYKYWVPIISLYSGMRLNEICQLKVQDIKKDEKTNIDYFFVTDDAEDQSVKNCFQEKSSYSSIFKKIRFYETSRSN